MNGYRILNQGELIEPWDICELETKDPFFTLSAGKRVGDPETKNVRYYRLINKGLGKEVVQNKKKRPKTRIDLMGNLRVCGLAEDQIEYVRKLIANGYRRRIKA